MNKRQWKKWRKKEKLRIEALYKKLGVDKWASNLVFKNIAEQIMSETVPDVGIRIKRRSLEWFGARKLGEEE